MAAQRTPSNLKEAREKRDLSQGQLAKRLGVRQSYISMVESGERIPSMLLAQVWAAELVLTLDRFGELLRQQQREGTQ